MSNFINSRFIPESDTFSIRMGNTVIGYIYSNGTPIINYPTGNWGNTLTTDINTVVTNCVHELIVMSLNNA